MKIPLKLTLLLLLCSSLGLVGCADDHPVEEGFDPPTLQAATTVVGTYIVGPGGGGCNGLVSYSMTYVILDETAYPGYDLAILATPGAPLDLPQGCACKQMRYCVTLGFPIGEVHAAGFMQQKSPATPFYSVKKDGQGGYLGHNDPRINRGSTGGAFQPHVICTDQADGLVVLFDNLNDFPADFDLADAVVAVEGICIADNVPDPNG